MAHFSPLAYLQLHCILSGNVCLFLFYGESQTVSTNTHATPTVAIPRKPFGIILIAIYTGFWGVIALFFSTILLVMISMEGHTAWPPIPAWRSILCILGFGFGVLELASCYGLWMLERWGITLTVAMQMASIPLGLFAIFPGFPESSMTMGKTLFQLVGVGVAVIILVYLFKPRVKELFRHRGI